MLVHGLPIISGFRRRRRDGRATSASHCISLLMAAALTFLASPSESRGQEVVDRGPALKAAFLAKFAKYVEWPKETFADGKSPLMIGAIASGPVGAKLQEIGNRKLVIGDRQLGIKLVQRPEDLVGCHIVYLPDSLNEQQRAACLKLLSGRHVLLVGDAPSFLTEGGVLQFSIESNRLRGKASRSAIEREGLKISSDLLSIFQPVD